MLRLVDSVSGYFDVLLLLNVGELWVGLGMRYRLVGLFVVYVSVLI